MIRLLGALRQAPALHRVSRLLVEGRRVFNDVAPIDLLAPLAWRDLLDGHRDRLVVQDPYHALCDGLGESAPLRFRCARPEFDDYMWHVLSFISYSATRADEAHSQRVSFSPRPVVAIRRTSGRIPG